MSRFMILSVSLQLAFTGILFTQANRASITGAITDSTGAVITGVLVSVEEC